MTKWLQHSRLLAFSWLLVLIHLNWPPMAISQTKAEQEAEIKSESRDMVVEGRRGIWFPMVSARQLLTAHMVCEKMQQGCDLTEQQFILAKERADLLQKNAEANAAIAVTWQQTARDQQEVLARRDVWYKSPYIWLAVGFIVGTGATIGITATVKATP